MKRELKRGRRSKGFTLLELILVLAVFVAFVGIAFGIYKGRVEPSRWANAKYMVFQSVSAAIENARAAYGGAYPAGTIPNLGVTTPPSGNVALVWHAVNGGGVSQDIAGWGYECTGNNLEVTVPYGDAPSNSAKEIFRSSVEKNTEYQLVNDDTTNKKFVFQKRYTVVCM